MHWCATICIWYPNWIEVYGKAPNKLTQVNHNLHRNGLGLRSSVEISKNVWLPPRSLSLGFKNKEVAGFAPQKKRENTHVLFGGSNVSKKNSNTFELKQDGFFLSYFFAVCSFMIVMAFYPPLGWSLLVKLAMHGYMALLGERLTASKRVPWLVAKSFRDLIGCTVFCFFFGVSRSEWWCFFCVKYLPMRCLSYSPISKLSNVVFVVA